MEDTVSFRCDRQKFGLTYSCPVDAEDNPITSHAELLEFIESVGGEVKKYTIGKELHENKKVHWHVFVQYKKAFASRNALAFDFRGVHPNHCVRKGIKGDSKFVPGQAWEAYCVKHGDFVSNYWKVDVYAAAWECESWEDAAGMLIKSQPKFMLQYAATAERNWKRRRVAWEPSDKVYPGEYVDPPTEWDPTSQSLVICGKPGLGKSQWAFNWAIKNHGSYFKTTEYLGIAAYAGEPVIIFDDAADSLNKESKDVWRDLFDVEGSVDFRRLHGVTKVKAGVVRIFLHNGDLEPVDYKERLVRRHFNWEVSSKMFISSK